MDYSKFQDENFDVKDWINGAFKSQKEGSKDQYATTLVMKLQMFIQEVNNIIEDSCQQAIQNLPRVMRELEAVRQEAALLQDQMRMVKQDIEKVEHDTAQSMQMLLQLDNIKSRMKAASDALQEADNWTTLSADVEEVFESQDVNAISEKLVGMQQSLQMLVDVPDYVERCQFLETLKNRLEAMLSPQLVAAFNAQSLEAAQMYVRIFTNIDRLPQLTKYYHKCQKGQLVQSWRAIQEDSSNETLLEWLPNFYDGLLSTWHSQIQWCGQVFSDPVPIVCELLTETLKTLDPSLPTCIATHLRDNQAPLQTLIDLKQISERFSKSIEGAIDSYTMGKLGPQYQECLTQLATTIYITYRPYVQQYGQYEAQLLMQELNSIPLDHEDVLESVRLLGESVSKLFSAANKANERCLLFTNGCGYVHLLQALQTYFSEYLKEFRRVLTNLWEKCRHDTSSMDAEDWTWFQHSLRIIQTCGELIMHAEELDQSLVTSIMDSVGKYYMPPSPSHRGESFRSPFTNHSRLLLGNPDDQRAVEALVTKLEEGDTAAILEEVVEEVCSLSETVHKFAFDIVFAPLNTQLGHLPIMEIWTSQSAGGALTANLPTFSLSPLEYITKVGQYLLTLPQQLEPFTMQDNPAVIVALKHGRLPYTNPQELPEHLADLWLESIARGTMHTYSEQVLKIPELSDHATRQLITDIDYLCNVLDDLGLQSSDTMTNLATLLKTAEDQYSDIAETMPQRLAHAVAAMRSLKLD